MPARLLRSRRCTSNTRCASGSTAQLMLALYRSGRQADALEVYQRTRRSLDDELGIEPGPALRELERKILNQDESLGQAAAPPESSRAGASDWRSSRRLRSCSRSRGGRPSS